MTAPRTGACPQCRKPAVLEPENVFRPFCSERCKLLDLGQWFSGGFSIPAVESEDDNDLTAHDQDSRLQ